MASALVSVEALKLALGETGTTNDQQYELLIDQVQAVFEGECNRHERPFLGAQDGRVEVFDGIGATELFVAYPIATLTSIKLGPDSADPDETLDVGDKRVVSWEAGSRRLVRTDGGDFGAEGAARVVEVTYHAKADLPGAARAAVLAGAQLLVNRLGAEGVASERIGGYSIDYASFVTADMANDPMWKLGVRSCWEPRT